MNDAKKFENFLHFLHCMYVRTYVQSTVPFPNSSDFGRSVGYLTAFGSFGLIFFTRLDHFKYMYKKFMILKSQNGLA